MYVCFTIEYGRENMSKIFGVSYYVVLDNQSCNFNHVKCAQTLYKYKT